VKITIEIDTSTKSSGELSEELATILSVVNSINSIDLDLEIELKVKPELPKDKPGQPWKPNIYGDGIRYVDPVLTTINNFSDSARSIKQWMDEAKLSQGHLSGE
jgi:hypothetical protein